MRAHLLIHHVVFIAVLASATPVALSQPSPPDVKAAVDAAWQRAAQARTLEARREEAAAGSEAARSWIAGSPAFGLAQRSDRWNNREGVREAEVSLSAPLWLPHQKSARQTQAQRSTEDLEAQIALARLTLAGEVRERLWAVALAKEVLIEARNHRKHLEAMADEVLRRVKAGDLARTDGILARQEALAGKAAAVDAQVKLQEALSRFTRLTGLDDIPPAEPERITAAMQEPHPRIVAARAAVQHAQASISVIDSTRSEPPTFGISMRRERDGSTSAPASSIAVAVQIPIGTNARILPLETAAKTQLETAIAEAVQAEVVLRADVELARHQLAAAEQALETASSRAMLAREHAQLIEKAFRLGERGLAEMLRARTVLHEADVAERQQRVAVGLAHARLNQAFGILP